MTARPRPYTPAKLAERWHCSAETIRQMCHRGELHHFRVGSMLRIPASAVEERETWQASASADSEGGRQARPAEAINLRHARERRGKHV